MADGNRIHIIPIDMPENALLTLSLMAHEKNVTLNDMIVGIAVDEAKRIIEESKNGG